LHILRKKVPHLFLEFNQRHFITMRKGVQDGYMEFDIDTLGEPFIGKKSKCKYFPHYLDLLRAVIKNKKRINGQVMFKCRFFLNETEGIDKPEFLNMTKETVKALKPLYDFLKE